jgi:transcriptional regulator with XRE-family HTH domain
VYHPEKLGDFIAKEREKRFPSRRVFAKKIGIDAVTVGYIENGDTKSPGLETILAIADGLKVSPMKLISIYKGEDPNTAEDSKQVESSVVEFVGHLPERLLMEVLFARRHQVFKSMLSSYGKDEIRELMQEVLKGKSNS